MNTVNMEGKKEGRQVNESIRWRASLNDVRRFAYREVRRKIE